MGIIYKATNKINNHLYIGKTVRGLKERKYQHKHKALKYKLNFAFHSAIRKYGFENFEWLIIDTAESEKELNEKEIYWIAEYKKTNKVYNMTIGGDGTCGCFPSEETKRKASESHKKYKPTEETKLKISKAFKGRVAPNKGKPMHENTKTAILKAITGKPCSEKKKIKIGEAQKGIKNHMYGKKRSEESKIKTSQTLRKTVELKKQLGIPWQVKINIKEVMKL